MGSIGPLEILIVLVVALLVLGPQKLPDAARSVGRAIGEVRRYTTGFQNEMRDAFADPAPSTRPPPATAAETPIPDGEAPLAAGGTPAPTMESGPGVTPSEHSGSGQMAAVSESIDMVPGREQETVSDEVSRVTDNGDAPSA
ncbi:MAG: twin-arginine translocase TatA/TatE family subunit [Actinomycetota bacterium]|nr:twin-arginine translocase TatA/TatE family subunit [Actinomycetota bacterium]